MNALRAQKLLGDDMWGVIPLDLRNIPGNIPGNKMHPMTSPLSVTTSSTSPSALEIKRLTHERLYLQARLQEMSRTLERRAEGIKAYFENDLKKSRMRETRYKAQTDSKNSTLSLLEARVAESEKARKDHEEKTKLKIEALEQENAALVSKAALKKSDEISLFETQLLNASNRYATLECEHNLIRRACAKSEVRARGLERDVIRLQAALSAGMTRSTSTGTDNGQAQILDSSAGNRTSLDIATSNENLNISTEQVTEKNGDADSVEQGKMLLLQRIEALEKALNQKQIENDLKEELQIPVLAANHTGDRNGKKETNCLGNSGTKEEVRSRGNKIENIVESDTEDDEETEDGEEEDSESSGDDNDIEGEVEIVAEVEKKEEQRLIAIRDQLHRTREAWHADQGASSRQGQGQGHGQGQGRGIGHAAGSVQRDVPPTMIKSTGSDSRGTSQRSSSQGSHKEKDAVDSRYRDKVKVKDRSKEKREVDVSRMEGKAVTAEGTLTAPSPATKGREEGKKRNGKGAGQGTLSDIGHSGGSQTQDLYAAQLARLMSMAEEVISRK